MQKKQLKSLKRNIKLFGWSNKRYDQEYWGRLERNQRQWKGKQSGERKMETIVEEEEIKEEDSEVISQMVTYLVCDELKYGFKSAYEQSQTSDKRCC